MGVDSRLGEVEGLAGRRGDGVSVGAVQPGYCEGRVAKGCESDYE